MRRGGKGRGRRGGREGGRGGGEKEEEEREDSEQRGGIETIAVDISVAHKV